MARPTKQGIDYFPLDVRLDDDDKLSMIIGDFGFKGELIFIKLLSWIYGNQGYYTDWTDQEQLKFAKRVAYVGGSSVNLINEVVAGCVKWGLFDKSVFDSFHILTSRRIQTTWIEATRKRKGRVINPKIWIIGVNDGVKPEETQKNPEETQQSKVKKSKVNDYVVTSPPIDGFRMIENQKERVLKDQNFTAQINRLGVPVELIPKWLDAFNRHLTFAGDTLKQERDYRLHFSRWLPKIPNYQAMNPDEYKPAGQPLAGSTPGRKVILEYFMGGEVEWPEDQYLQYCKNPAASGYTFLRYAD